MQTIKIPQQYTITSAVNRLINRFKSEKVYVKQEDLNALKTIAETLNFFFGEVKKTDNLYFKLSAKLFSEYLAKHKSWDVAKKALVRDLQMPIDFYEMMVKSNSDMVMCLKEFDKTDYSDGNTYLENKKVLDNLNEKEIEKLKNASFGTPQEEVNRYLHNILSDLFVEFNTKP